LLAVSLDFMGVPPGGSTEVAGSEVVVADVDTGEELWRADIFPPEAENTSSPLYGSNTLSDRGSQGAEGLRATILTWVAELQSWIVDGDAGFRRP